MGTAKNLIRKLESLDLPNEVVQSVNDTKDEFLQIQTDGQMLYGKDSDGNSIAPNYASKSYARKKVVLNPNAGFGTPDLRISGVFYNRTKIVNVDSKEIVIDSDAKHAKYIEARYSNRIYGLSPENSKKYAFGAFFEALSKRIENKIGLKFGR